MADRFFESNDHASLYQKYMIREGDMVRKLIFSYLEEKKGRPFGLAVDVGCGTGASTRFLGPHFKKVIGVDNSEAQIQEAKRVESAQNISYMLAAAEHLPVEDGSVDLITSSVAAHWFNLEEFLREVDRVLQSRGCLALYTLHPHFDIHYNGCSERLTATYMEVTHITVEIPKHNAMVLDSSKSFQFSQTSRSSPALQPVKQQQGTGKSVPRNKLLALTFLTKGFGNEKMMKIVESGYAEIFDAINYVDKIRVTNIPTKRQMSIAALMGFTRSSFLFQKFLKTDKEAAKEFLQNLEQRFLMIMGASSTDVEMEFCNDYTVVLACKPAH